MQASTFAVKGNLGFNIKNHRVLPELGEFWRRRRSALNDHCMKERNSCFGLRVDSVSMGAELVRARASVQSAFRSSVKARSVKAQASGLCICFPFSA